METLEVKFRNVNSSEVDTFGILLETDSDKFSAKKFKEVTRQTIFAAIQLKSNQRSFSNGSRVEISSTWQANTVKLRPVYLGGGRNVKEVSKQLEMFVREVK
jgi:hypothetical protein